MTVEEATGIVEALTAFYRCPVLKQLALCLMVRQMQDAEIARSRKKYMYLSLFCESEHFWVNINTVEKWLMCARERPCNDKGKPSCKVSCYMYPECIPELNCGIVEGKDSHNLPRRRVSLRQSMLWKSVSRLNDVLSNFSDHKLSISFTEFVAAQMMEELVHRSDLILDTFAGLRSEIPGRRSILIDARDLKRLLNPIYRCSTLDLEDVLRQTELIALCTYLGNLATDEESKTRVFHLLKHTIDPKAGTKHMKLTIDEFFVMMKSSNTVKTVEDTLKEGHHRPCDGYEAVKRRLILNKLQEIDEHCTNRKRKRRVLRG
nr:calmodulin-domain protein kinase 2 [Babesia bovis]